jgi:hypothetical protein
MNGGLTIRNLLFNDSAVNAIVGTRIYPNYVPQDVSNPCITYMIDSDGMNTKSGHSGYESTARINIFVDENNYSTGVDLSEKVRLALDDTGDSNTKTIDFQGCVELFDFDSNSHQFSHIYRMWQT